MQSISGFEIRADPWLSPSMTGVSVPGTGKDRRRQIGKSAEVEAGARGT